MEKPDRKVLIAAIIGAVGLAVIAFIVSSLATNPARSSHSNTSAGPPDFWWLILGIAVIGLLVIIPVMLVFRQTGRGRLDRSSMSFREMYEWKLRDLSRQNIRMELWIVVFLLVLAYAAFSASYFASHAVLESVREQRFGPNETAQVITAIGGVGLAIGTSIAAIIKAYALLIRARADFMRAQMESELSAWEKRQIEPHRQLKGPK
jgi:formate-dependent nitrite reductase membrane component NrfD